MRRLLLYFSLLISGNLLSQEPFIEKNTKKDKQLNNALNLSVKKFIKIEKLTDNGLHEWITVNPENGDTLLYKGLMDSIPIGRWKGIRGKRIFQQISDNRTSMTISNVNFEINERKFDLLKYDTTKIKALSVPDSLGRFDDNKNGFLKFMRNNLEYPNEARELNMQGTAYAKLRLDTSGVLHFESILKSAHPFLDVEIIKMIEKCPRWKYPAIDNGEVVEYFFVQPFKWTRI